MRNTRLEGNIGEDIAMMFLTKQGVEILERNYRIKGGEIDIIYKDGDYLSFAEVKYRSSDAFGQAYEAVDYAKRKRICKASRVYLYSKHIPENVYIRYDVISIMDKEVTWYKNAFDYAN